MRDNLARAIETPQFETQQFESQRGGAAIAEASFKELTEPHEARLIAVARRILGSDDLAWDAVQEAFTALWNEPVLPVDMRGWLVRTVVHRSLHASRSLQRRRRHEDVAREKNSASIEFRDPAADLEGRELRDLILEAVQQLPADFRRVLELREFHAMDYDSISKRTGTPVGTVRSRLNRARAALRGILAPRIGAYWNHESEDDGQ